MNIDRQRSSGKAVRQARRALPTLPLSVAEYNPGDDSELDDWRCIGPECRFQEELILLRQQVRTDTLTGLFNLRHLLDAMEHEIERTHRSQQSVSLMMIDIDHFKQINDHWGHEAGNKVLVAVAAAIKEQTRRLDIQCRYGGEEFAVVLPSSPLRVARNVAERLRLAIEALVVPFEQETIRVTVSIGIACLDTDTGIKPGEWIHRADEQLYRAKQEGRNRVCVAPAARSKAAVSADEKDMMRSLFGARD